MAAPGGSKPTPTRTRARPGSTPSSTPSTPPGPAVTPSPDHDASHNWSGYTATGGKYTAVSGTWTVPSIEATGELGVGATWVGIGGTTTRDLIQAGTQETTVASGRVRYNAWIETLPEPSRPVPLVVSPGDSVTVSIGETSKDKWLVVLKNNTTGKSYQETITYASSYSSAEWVVEAPSSSRSLLPLSFFGSIQFSEGTATRDGKPVTIAQAKATPVTMVDYQGNVLATPSALTADGKGFTVTRSDNPASTQPTTPSRPGRTRGR